MKANEANAIADTPKDAMTTISVQPRSGASLRPIVRKASARTNEIAPNQSKRILASFFVSRMTDIAIASAARSMIVPVRNIDRHPKCSIKLPDMMGPRARPIPKVVPIMLKARVCACPVNSWASAAEPPARAAAAPAP